MAVRHYTLTLNGSAQRLSTVLTDTTPGGINDESCRQILCSADPANANAVYIGGLGVTAANHGFSLDPTQATQLPVSIGPFDAGVVKPSELYVIGTNAEKLHVLLIPYQEIDAMSAYAVTYQRTASTTASLGTFVANATRPRRAKWYDIDLGSEATPADNPFLYTFQRCTAAGTSTAVTPQPLDPADAATESTAGQNHTVEPTYTANAILLRIALNQRATFRWVARDGKELVTPATASNGIGIQTPTAGAVVITTTAHIEEQ